MDTTDLSLLSEKRKETLEWQRRVGLEVRWLRIRPLRTRLKREDEDDLEFRQISHQQIAISG
ncbi:unnamed protein product, partial [Arabidopsis halleri]